MFYRAIGFFSYWILIGAVVVYSDEPLVIESNVPILWRSGAFIAEDYAWNGEDYDGFIQSEWQREDKIDGTYDRFYEAAQKHYAAACQLLERLTDDLEPSQVAAEQTALAELAHQLTALENSCPETTSKVESVTNENGTIKINIVNHITIANHSKNDSQKIRAIEEIYAKIRGIKRRIALSNPLFDFERLLFCKRIPGNYSHEVQQYFGWRARVGGGLFILQEPGRSLACQNLLEGQLPDGSFLEPRLSPDGNKVVFSYVNLENGKTFDPLVVHYNDPDEGFYHLYEVHVDGSNLKQLTSGSFDDITPSWLPDGDVVFSSTRRKGNGRCHWWGIGNRWNTYTIHRMSPKTGEITTLSYHDTNEWFPEASETGLVVYSRWDYIDRDAVTHQNLWSMRPDGTNPSAVWGNATPKPHCTFQAKPIPGTGKFVFTASAHHSITGGPLVILDPHQGIDGEQSLEKITKEVPYPEVDVFKISEYYESPFPLSEEFFLASYSPYPLCMEGESNRENALGLYFLDTNGNREPIYRDPKISSVSAAPIMTRENPPILASHLPVDAPDYGEMAVTDVYEGLGDGIARGEIKELRIVQLFPKTTRDWPPIGLAGEENGRAILGTVPVESDGSAYFRVPAKKAFYLQAIDQQGRAYQTMRSLTYLQPGEKVSCTGCHENKESSGYRPLTLAHENRLDQTVESGVNNDNLSGMNGNELVLATQTEALSREPSEIDPGELGGRPFSYVEIVQPIFDAKCVSCHNDTQTDGGINLTGTPQDANYISGMKMFEEGNFKLYDPPADIFTKSYYALCKGMIFYGDNGLDSAKVADALVPRFGGRNTIQVTEPGGRYGSIGSRLMKILDAEHENVSLTDSERRRLCAWIDMNAIFYGVYEPEAQMSQRAGLVVPMPEIQ